MKRQEKLVAPDPYLLGVALALVTAGVLLVFDASYARMGDARWAHFDSWYAVKRQLVYACAGLVAMSIVARMRLRTFIRWTAFLLIFSLALLVAAKVSGHARNGAERWVFGIQPSEVAKIALVLYLAGIMARGKTLVRRLSVNWIGPLLIVGAMAGLIFVEPDMGTALALLGTALVMLYAGGVMKRHLLGLVLGLIGLTAIAVKIQPYRLARVWVWLDPWKYRFGDGYQIIHALTGLGTGGLAGVGLCEGREKLYIPAASTDFIFATLAEEAGLIGGIILIALFIFFTWRGLDIARRSKSTYANLLAVGVTSVISLQALINIAVVSASIPATGVPLPFISYGGSSLVLMMVGVGMLLAISKQVDVEMDERDLYESSANRWRDGRPHLPRDKRRSGPPKR